MTIPQGTCCGNPKQAPSPVDFLEEALSGVSQEEEEEEEVFFREPLGWEDAHTGMVAARRGCMAFRPGATGATKSPLPLLSCHF